MPSDRQHDEIPQHLRRLIPFIAQGYSNAEIANDLGLSKHTVENYVSALTEIVGVANRLQLLIWAQSLDERR